MSFVAERYFKRGFNLKTFGVDSNAELMELVQDAVGGPKACAFRVFEVELSASGYLEPQLSKDTPLENFVRLTEDARRERQLRIDLGESTALKMPRPLGAKGPGKGTKGQPFRAPQPNYGYENRFQGAIVASRPKF